MFVSPGHADEMLQKVISVLGKHDDELLGALDELPAPIYVTDAEGVITYFNPCCLGFAGRTPRLGKDRWCVSWKFYTEAGDFMPHELCPMADAIKTGRAIRGVSAVAERPDGTRVHFMPFPTPLFSGDGELTGAVNLLLDVTERRQANELREQAERCRRLIGGVGDQRTRDMLARMAAEYDRKADELDSALLSG